MKWPFMRDSVFLQGWANHNFFCISFLLTFTTQILGQEQGGPAGALPKHSAVGTEQSLHARSLAPSLPSAREPASKRGGRRKRAGRGGTRGVSPCLSGRLLGRSTLGGCLPARRASSRRASISARALDTRSSSSTSNCRERGRRRISDGVRYLQEANGNASFPGSRQQEAAAAAAGLCRMCHAEKRTVNEEEEETAVGWLQLCSSLTPRAWLALLEAP